MTATLTYQADIRTLHVEGTCEAADTEGLESAIDTFGRLAQDLTVDLTRLDDVSPQVADLLAESGRQALRDGRSLTLSATPGSRVDEAVLAAGARTSARRPLE